MTISTETARYLLASHIAAASDVPARKTNGHGAAIVIALIALMLAVLAAFAK